MVEGEQAFLLFNLGVERAFKRQADANHREPGSPIRELLQLSTKAPDVYLGGKLDKQNGEHEDAEQGELSLLACFRKSVFFLKVLQLSRQLVVSVHATPPSRATFGLLGSCACFLIGDVLPPADLSVERLPLFLRDDPFLLSQCVLD